MTSERHASTDAIRYAIGESSLGSVLVAASDAGVCALLLGDTVSGLSAELHRRFPHSDITEATAGLAPLLAAAVRLAENPADDFEPPLDLRGTLFQQRVWAALREIPAGVTATYAQVAADIGAPGAARAVAGACAANHVAVAVPCHRVVRSGGGLSGYRWGVGRKRELLAREGARVRA